MKAKILVTATLFAFISFACYHSSKKAEDQNSNYTKAEMDSIKELDSIN
jgi:hypothetical protein